MHILGFPNLQNELLREVLEAKVGISTSLVDQLQALPREDADGEHLLLIDTSGIAVLRLLRELKDRDVCASCLVALFNLRHGLEIEQEAIGLGVRGFFYQNESVELLLKGVRLLFQGQIWLSREVMIEALMNGKGRRSARERVGLTAREVEILALVAAGANNRDIAERLYISENTVKTHLYNIFKKIEVPNRLQAALWAVNNLELT